MFGLKGSGMMNSREQFEEEFGFNAFFMDVTGPSKAPKLEYVEWLEDRVEKLESRRKELQKALTTYVRKYEKGKCWNWLEIPDPHGTYWAFDWEGDDQDKPWEIAEKPFLIPEKEKPKENDDT
jgi:hypothetical protein